MVVVIIGMKILREISWSQCKQNRRTDDSYLVKCWKTTTWWTLYKVLERERGKARNRRQEKKRTTTNMLMWLLYYEGREKTTYIKTKNNNSHTRERERERQERQQKLKLLKKRNCVLRTHTYNNTN